MSHPTGHLFLVRGRIETVVHDAAVVPTDDRGEVAEHWRPVVDGGPSVWFVSVGNGDGLPPEELVRRVLDVVGEVAAADLPPAGGRVKPVLAVPVLGLEGGGHDRDRGEVVQALLAGLLDAVTRVDLDIAVVVPDPSVHAAAQHVRAALAPPALEPGLAEEADRLGALARRGELALFLGAGVSVPAGLPSWSRMLALLAERTGRRGRLDVERLSLLDRAQLLEQQVPDLGRQVAELCGGVGRGSLAHGLLAGLGCREAVTTNYDRLLETAVRAAGGEVAVLPWESPVGAPGWVLKLHGDVDHPGSIVLTRRDVVRFAAEVGPTGAMLQNLLLTRHLLVVGSSMTDDNVVRLAQEVQVHREQHGVTGEFGTVLDVDDDAARGELWSCQLRWLTLPGDRLEERTRSLEVFLDAVAARASDDARWLLDPRFAGLLDAEERELAEQVRRVRTGVEGHGPEWRPLLDALDRLGADAS
ncbi:SIR2 family protein [Nocardioides deserti]|uniref:SIR2 family protein n=1 Tax=Nocardioides deserti TaxID=1588644 RepID=A0ABR6U8X7_9ACTN|nr:SIR2 family protein [Nocardioides deserti]MBC2960823.1 SIR2 family protein [Nocardioides deserti]GGO77477.1 SIR2 family protein [Nocardioides deserti]